MGGPIKSFRFVRKIAWKNLNELFDRPSSQLEEDRPEDFSRHFKARVRPFVERGTHSGDYSLFTNNPDSRAVPLSTSFVPLDT